MCSKHVEAWDKLIIKFSAPRWLILRNKYTEMHGQQNIKKKINRLNVSIQTGKIPSHSVQLLWVIATVTRWTRNCTWQFQQEWKQNTLQIPSTVSLSLSTMMFPSLWPPQGQTRQLSASAIRLMSGQTDRHKQPAAVLVTRASYLLHVFEEWRWYRFRRLT